MKKTIGSYNYVFNYTDHLGNIRLSYTKNPIRNVLTILEENNYYPFGLKHRNYNMSKRQYDSNGGNVVIIPTNETVYDYKYNGKEWQDELSLNLYDYGARNYDAALGRWMNMDPLAEASRRWSPYNYCYSNPMYFIDPDGMQSYPPTEEELNNLGIAVSDVQHGYTWTDNDGSWSFNSETKTWEGINGTGTDILAETVNLPEMTIVKEKPLMEKASELLSDMAAPFFETPQDILFPIINQVNVIANEGIHEGGAYNSDNVLLPNTYELKNWKPVSGRSNTSTGNPTREEGQEIINNTISVVPVGVTTGLGKNAIQKFVIDKAATSAAKTIAKKATEKIR